jgi:hypothetical protein
MSAIPVRVAARIVRGWTHLYTWCLPEPLAVGRRREIESDLWELQHDPDGNAGINVAGQILARMLLGMPDDVCWRLDHAADDVAARRMAARALVAAVLVVTVWTGQAWLSDVEPKAAMRVDDCARKTASLQSMDQWRLRIMDCTGAFFTPGRNADGRPSRR